MYTSRCSTHECITMVKSLLILSMRCRRPAQSEMHEPLRSPRMYCRFMCCLSNATAHPKQVLPWQFRCTTQVCTTDAPLKTIYTSRCTARVCTAVVKSLHNPCMFSRCTAQSDVHKPLHNPCMHCRGKDAATPLRNPSTYCRGKVAAQPKYVLPAHRPKRCTRADAQPLHVLPW